MALFRGREMIFEAFKSGTFSLHAENFYEQSEH